MRPSRTIVSLLQLALVIAVPGTLVACGGERASDTDAEATMEDAAPMDDGAAMDQDAGADDGIGAGAEATAVPDWFPQDVYLPADYTVVVARNMGDVQQVELRVPGAAPAIAAEAGDAMEAQGWEENMESGPTTGYQKGQRMVSLTVADRDEGGVRVTYQLVSVGT